MVFTTIYLRYDFYFYSTGWVHIRSIIVKFCNGVIVQLYNDDNELLIW